MKNNFKISYKQGKIFSVLSEDFNKIHINEIVGYNSMFGQNICHGVLVIIMFLKLQKINFYKIKNFKKGFFIHYKFEGNKNTLNEINKKIKLDGTIIRHLTVKYKKLDTDKEYFKKEK